MSVKELIEYKEKPNTDEELYGILNPIVKKWFKDKFKDFAIPQKYALMEVHSRNNVLVSAPTGSGKTLTAFLSILNELIDCSEKGILKDKTYAIYISPLKALSNDIVNSLVLCTWIFELDVLNVIVIGSIQLLFSVKPLEHSKSHETISPTLLAPFLTHLPASLQASNPSGQPHSAS